MNSENGPDRRRIEFERRELRLNGKFSEAKELLESELSNKDKGRRHRALILKDIAPIYAELGEDEKSYDAYYEIVYPQSGTRTSMSSEPDVLVSFAEIAYKLGKKMRLPTCL